MKICNVLILCAAVAGCRAAAEDVFTVTGEPRVDVPVVVRDDPAPAPTGRIRVASYNIENFTDAERDGDKRTAAAFQRQARGAAQIVEDIRPDVLLIQEIESAKSLEALNTAMTNAYPVGRITRFADRTKSVDKLNIAVLSRIPISDVREIDFFTMTGSGRPTRGLLSFTIDLGEGHRLLVYGVHLKSNFGSRPRNIAQRRAALDVLRSDAEAIMKAAPGVTWEVLVLGDTNVDPESAGFETDTSFQPLDGWVDVWRGRPLAERITMPTRVGIPGLEFPPATFDRFFVSPALTNAPWSIRPPVAIQKGVNTKDASADPGMKSHVSDHYPVYMDIVR